MPSAFQILLREKKCQGKSNNMRSCIESREEKIAPAVSQSNNKSLYYLQRLAFLSPSTFSPLSLVILCLTCVSSVSELLLKPMKGTARAKHHCCCFFLSLSRFGCARVFEARASYFFLLSFFFLPILVALRFLLHTPQWEQL